MEKDAQVNSFDLPSTKQIKETKAAMEKYGPEYQKAMDRAERIVQEQKKKKQAQLQQEEEKMKKEKMNEPEQDKSIGKITNTGISIDNEGEKQDKEVEITPSDILNFRLEETKKEAKQMKPAEGKDTVRRAEKKKRYLEYALEAQSEAMKYKLKKRRLKDDLAEKEKKVQEELTLLQRVGQVKPESAITTYELRKLVKMQQEAETQRRLGQFFANVHQPVQSTNRVPNVTNFY